MNGYLTELIGTFALVLTVGCTVLSNAALAPLAIGAALNPGSVNSVFRVQNPADA